MLRARERVCRTVETMGGPVQLERPYVSCRSCRLGRYPFDEALGGGAGCTQLDRHKAAAQLVTEVPSDTAQALVRELTGVPFGSERRHTVTNHMAQELTVLDVVPPPEAIQRRVAAVAAGRWRRPVVVLGIDGAYVPTRPDSAREHRPGPRGQRARRALWRGQWRDAKGFRCSLLDGDRLVPLLSWHQVHNERERGEALQEVQDAGVIPAGHVRLCVVADGAAWIGKHVQALLPQARQVLDSSHGAHYIHTSAKAHSGTSLQGLEWAEATMTRRYVGTVSAVLGGLRRMQPTSDEAAQAMANGWESLHEHRGHTNYRQLRRGGYPLGSGGIASSNKCIGHVRLKRSGAWWYEANSHQMFALRCAK